MVTLRFASGTLELSGLESTAPGVPDFCRWDFRAACFRAPASSYADLVRALGRAGIDYQDQARNYQKLEHGLRLRREPRPYQQQALAAWLEARGRGVVVLPTGAGKTEVGLMAIDDRRRSTLVVTPTLDLVQQWYDLLRKGFGVDVGLVGGGDYQVLPITVTTYDSAYLHMDHLGNRFGLVIFDECHHLPGTCYALAAEFCLAPYRLGLTATPERADGREQLLEQLVGPIVLRREISDLDGSYLARYRTIRVEVELDPTEWEEYQAERAVYLGFLRQQGLRLGSPRSFGEFIRRASRSAAGQRALKAYWRQRELAFAARAKLDQVELLLRRHAAERILVFTDDNATAYEVSRRFLVPAITHQTRVRERSEILARFAAAEYGVIVTSRVLNEGIDVPEASVAIVLSGTGSVREHVQRLGRVLRPRAGKQAVLYELVSAHTSEIAVSERRRSHVAYRDLASPEEC